MKKLISIVASMLFFFSGRAQQIPLANFYAQGSKWTEYYYVNGGQGTGGIFGQKYMINADSMINGQNYHLLYQEKVGTCNLTWWGNPAPQSCWIDTGDFHYKLVGGIRIDSQKVYCYITDSMAVLPFHLPVRTDFVLYDFGPHNVGDTLPGYSQPISSIDSVAFSNGIKLPRYNIYYSNNLYELYEIYGIGSRSGLLNLVSATTPYSQHALCYTTDAGQYTFADSVLPMGLDTNCFNIMTTGVSTIKQEKLSISPNPSTNDYIELTGTDGASIASINLYDMTGRTRYFKTNPFAGTNTTRLYIALEKGIYFVAVKYKDNSSQVQKLIRL